MSQKFQNLVKIISKFPGIGPRQAIRIVLALFNWSGQQIEELAKGILDLKQGLNLCRRCFNFSDDGLCEICQSQKRDQTRITVVEKITDLESMEKTGVFSGVYHVLGGAIDPPEGILPENLKIKELKTRLTDLKKLTSDLEVILATNQSASGETTALFLEEELKPLGVKVSRLARGLSAGTLLEYADETTLLHAFKNRR